MRLRLQFPALISADGLASAGTVRDLSTQGGRIECARFLALGQRITLQGDLFPAVLAKVCWRSGSAYGLAFEQVFSLEALAVMAAELQQVGETPPPAGERQVTRAV